MTEAQRDCPDCGGTGLIVGYDRRGEKDDSICDCVLARRLQQPPMRAMEKPCDDCPWRRDAPVGVFPKARYRALARCADDMSIVIFQCHKTPEGTDVACAGFLSEGARHNMAIRMAYIDGRLEPRDRSGGLALHRNFRSMAVAQGLDPDERALFGCRDD